MATKRNSKISIEIISNLFVVPWSWNRYKENIEGIIIRATILRLALSAFENAKNEISSETSDKHLSQKLAFDFDQDVTIVGTINAEVMSHFRSDCPVHVYIKIEKVDKMPHKKNKKFCSKCFCYICDKLAFDCEKWTDKLLPHCNANTKSSCWKARRNLTKSPLMNELDAEDISPEIQAAGLLATKFIVAIREAYLVYRKGTPCEFCFVPCQCFCHSNTQSADFCPDCKAIHDKKKKFNYAPVEKIIIDLFHQVQVEYKNDPYSALVLYEAILSEICTHCPADFNHVLKMPSNPNLESQCRTPRLLTKCFEMEFVKLFTRNEIHVSFKKKFIACVTDAVTPLQINTLLKRFFGLRHWNDLLLRAVLSGQNTSGKTKGDVLQEDALVVEMRVKKLMKDKRFLAVARYLNVVKLSKAGHHKFMDGIPFNAAIEKWMLESLLMRGKFREACVRFLNKLNVARCWTASHMLGILSLMSGKGLPPGTTLVNSYRSDMPSTYEIEGVDKTVLLHIYLVFYHITTHAKLDFSYHLWLASYVNKAKVEYEQQFELGWIRQSDALLALARSAYNNPTFVATPNTLTPICPQAAVVLCTSLLTDFFSLNSVDLKLLSEVVPLFKYNQWGLLSFFLNPTLLKRGKQTVSKCLFDCMKHSKAALYEFNKSSILGFFAAGSFTDICTFMSLWVSPSWKKKSRFFIGYFLHICSAYAARLIVELLLKRRFLEKFCNELFLDIIQVFSLKTLELRLEWIEHVGVIAKVCCIIDINNMDWCFDVVHDPVTKAARVAEVFGFFLQKFKTKTLSSSEVAGLFEQAIKHSNGLVIDTIIKEFTSTHYCSNLTIRLLIDKILEILNSFEFDSTMTKHDVIAICSQLIVNDSLGWLVCSACSRKMSFHWENVWIALNKNELKDSLIYLVDQTLNVFSALMSDLAVIEKGDINQLIKSMQAFLTNVVFMAVRACRFDNEKLKERFLSVRDKIQNISLSAIYLDLVQKMFAPLNQTNDDTDAATNSLLLNDANADLQIESFSRPPISLDFCIEKVENPMCDADTPFKLPNTEFQFAAAHCSSDENSRIRGSSFATNRSQLKPAPKSLKTKKVLKRRNALQSSTKSIDNKKAKSSKISIDERLLKTSVPPKSENTRSHDKSHVCSAWNIPSFIKIPSDFDMLIPCYVHLSSIPQVMIEKINNFQPDLGLEALYV